MCSYLGAAQPNIIFILIDDMHWNGSSVQIDPELPNSKSSIYQTPELEKLAAAGIRFTNAYAPGPMCSPSRAGILAGKTPAELQMTTPGSGRSQDYQKLIGADHIREFPTEFMTLAESLKTAGYATAHLGKWHIGRESPALHGFDLHDGPTANEVPNSSPENPKDIFGITERAIEFMEQQTTSKTPFYLQLSHYAVHSPIETRASSKAKFANLPSSQRLDAPSMAGMTYDIDASIGLLREKIEALGIAQNTYLVVMSDNGGMGSGRRTPTDAAVSGGKGSLQEGGIRIPFFAVGPGIKPNSISRESITGCDLYPTFCHWSGTPIPDDLEGMNLAPLLAGQQNKLPRRALLFHYPHYGHGPMQKPQSALILGDYKLLYDWESQSAQLFDLSKDLLETTDLSQELPEGAAKLTSQLFDRLNAVNAGLPSENPDYDASAKAPSGQRSGKRR